MKRNFFVNILLHFAVSAVFLSMAGAAQKSYVLGGEKGWTNILSADGVTVGKGRFGFDAMRLATQVPETDSGTGLLLSFDDGKIYDETGNYDVVDNYLISSTSAVKGNGSALSRGDVKGLVLRSKGDNGGELSSLSGSFTIEFWLSPSLVENGEMVYSWRSSMTYSDYSEFQTVSAVFSGNRLEWKFKNVFPSFSSDDIELCGYRAVIPDEWSRHTVSFDEETGCLEYLVDGKTEDIKYITSTGHERGTICMPSMGSSSVMEICPSFTGRIDNVRIQRSAYHKDDVLATGNENFKTSGGRFVSQPILACQAASLDSIDAVVTVPPQTEVKFFVRAGDNCYGWTDDYPEWQEVLPGESIEDVSGLYFQVASELLPDGNGVRTPSVTELTLNYIEPELPLPPFTVKAVPGDGQVTLTWSSSIDDSAGGYYVYYGLRSGEYLGRAALEGASPVNAGNYTSLTLTGLENGAIYYFAISSYSSLDNRITGELSQEVFARPSKRLARAASTGD